MKKILVTGANGLLATNTIHALIAAGYAVKGLLRNRKSYKGVTFPDLELTEGNFTDRNTIREAMSDCDGIVHIAACTGQNSGMDEYRRVNVEATRQLLEVSVETGIKRVVYISSANIFAYGSKERPGDETRSTIPPFTRSGYAQSKIEAQKVVDSFKDRLDIITLCPTFMLGPYDSKPSSGRIIVMGYRKKVMFYPVGGKNFVPVRDVAKGAVTALEKGTPGEAYVLAGENLSYKEFYTLLSERTGCKCQLIKLPRPLLMAVGKLGDFLSGTLKIKTELSTVNMELLCTGNYFGNTKAARELGFKCRPVSVAIDEAISWFRSVGMLK